MSLPRSRFALLVALMLLLASVSSLFLPKNDRSFPQGSHQGQPRATSQRITLPKAVDKKLGVAPNAESKLTSAINKGIPLRLTGNDFESKPIYFRPTTVTGEDFATSVGITGRSLEIESAEVFTGRSLLGGESATLAIVNGKLAAHLRHTDGSISHFRSNPENGELETFLERIPENLCAIDPNTNIAHTKSLTPLPPNPWNAAGSAAITPDPDIAASSGYNPANGNLQFTNRPIPYGRAYDQSLKDIIVLVVLDKGATGNASSGNLSSKTATYLSNMANVSAIYEHNLGLRIIVQELILTPNTDDYSDVANGSGALSDFRSWTSSNRPRGTYRWTVAAKFGAVNGNGTLGIAYVGAAGGTNGVSINRPGNIITVTHEVGHNMGSSHTNGGVMNPSIQNTRDFFRDLETQSRTSAWAIYNYMSNGGANTQGRAFPSNRRLRHAEQIPFAADDNVTTLPNQPVRFRPMSNDATSVRNGAENVLTLIEAGNVFPPGAGEAWIYGDEIEFRPASGFRGTAWLSYTIRGSVGNGGKGWLHKGDVAIRLDGSGTTPPNITTTTASPDFIHHAGSSSLTINPLVDDHSPGFLNVNHTTATLGTSGSAAAQTNGFFITNASLLDPSKGSLTFNRVDITRGGGSRVDLTRHLTFTPAAGVTGPVRIQYTVADGNGTTNTEIATILFGTDTTLIDTPANARFRVPSDQSESSTWTSETFDDSTWTLGETGIGYERSNSGTVYDSLIESDTATEMIDGGTSIYLRIPFEVDDPAAIAGLRLEMQYDDGFAAFINGVPVQSANAPDPPTWDGIATANHEADLVDFSSFDISAAIDTMHPGTNTLAIHGFNASSTSSDFIIRPRLIATHRFTLGGIDLPTRFGIPSDTGILLRGFLNGITDPPFTNAATFRWAALKPGVQIENPNQLLTTATFTKPGEHILRLRIEEAGYVEEHEVQIDVGTATPSAAPLAITEPDLIISTDHMLRLQSLTANANTVTWSQIDGPTATVAPDGTVNFSSTGTHTFRLSVTSGRLTVFNDINITRGSGIINLTTLGSLARHLVPSAATDLLDVNANAWTAFEFNHSNWSQQPALYGFERGSGYADLIQTDLQAAMHDTNSSLLVRQPFFSPINGPVTLSLRYEDGFAAYLNGAATSFANRPAGELVWDSAASASTPDANALITQQFTIGNASAGVNLLGIQGLNSSTSSSDFLLVPELTIFASSGTPFRTQLITAISPGKILTPTSAVPGWKATAFDDSSWLQSAAAIGYERSGGGIFDEHFLTDIEDQAYDQNQTTYLRIPFISPAEFAVRSLSLTAKYDDAFIAYLNGNEIARDNVTGSPSWNAAAGSTRDELTTTIPTEFDVSSSITSLRTGTNILAIHLLNSGITSSDLLFVPELVAELEPSIAIDAYLTWFQNFPGYDGQISDPTADPDSDGLSNLLEFAFGYNPFQPRTTPPTLAGNEFSYRRRTGGASQGISYQIESSPDLKTWNPIVPTSESTSTTFNPAIENVIAIVPQPTGRTYYRLRVVLN